LSSRSVVGLKRALQTLLTVSNHALLHLEVDAFAVNSPSIKGGIQSSTT